MPLLLKSLIASVIATGLVLTAINADALLQWGLAFNNGICTFIAGYITYLQDNEWKAIITDSPAGLLTIPLLICGSYVSAHCCFIAGKWLIKPVFSFLQTGDVKDSGTPQKSEKPIWLRTLLFVAPPLPSRKPGEAPVLDQKAVPFSIMLHAIPPPGLCAFMVFIDVLFGASAMPAWKFALGTLIGTCIHLGGLGVLYANQIEIPPPPGAVLIALLLAPAVLRTSLIVMRRCGLLSYPRHPTTEEP